MFTWFFLGYIIAFFLLKAFLHFWGTISFSSKSETYTKATGWTSNLLFLALDIGAVISVIEVMVERWGK
jgi:hypothetical protein